MDNKKAIQIFKYIHSLEYTVEEKQEAIKIILADEALHNSITKSNVLDALKWVTDPLVPRWVEKVMKV